VFFINEAYLKTPSIPIDKESQKMDYLSHFSFLSMNFVNFNPSSFEELPQSFSLSVKGESYRAHLIHAEIDHCNKPLLKRPDPHQHDCYHLLFVTGGKGGFLIGGKEYQTRPGQIYFTGPGELHQFLNVGSDSTQYAELTFELIHSSQKRLLLPFEAMLQTWINQPFTLPQGITLSPVTLRLFEGKLNYLIQRGLAQSSNLELNTLFGEILMFLTLSIPSPQALSKKHHLDTIRDYIRIHYQKELSLPDLATRAHLSPNYLSRHFKAQYGETPIHFQISLRIQSASLLLKTVNDPLDQIAFKVGFSDPYYFSRLFKKRMGLSPGRYRTLHLKSNNVEPKDQVERE
jgi:AraC-like DNA-binding protein/mannose-6-phosphate isomerase-like protein (cupin superfamily)